MDKPCPLLVHLDKGSASNANEIMAGLKGSDVAAKAEAMKRALTLLVNGETLPALLATVVRHVLPSSEDRTIQKLLLLYLEIIHEERDAPRRVLPETARIRQHLRGNLQHPDEYVRGVTLRFLCRLPDPELLEPLVPSVLENIRHRHHFVSRHAISTVSAIYRLPLVGRQLVPDAPEFIERALYSEQDASARRDALLALCLSAQDRAMAYIVSNAERVTEWPGLLQMVALALIGKVCRRRYPDKYRHVKIIVSLLSSPSTGAAVAYECAGALLSLSSAKTVHVRAAADAYCRLLSSESDDGVRLILVDRLNELRMRHRHVMVDVARDVLRLHAISSPSFDVKWKVLDLVLDLRTP